MTDRIPCSACMFWVKLDRPEKDGSQKGECRRHPSPQGLLRPADWWCGEGIHRSISPQGGRNK